MNADMPSFWSSVAKVEWKARRSWSRPSESGVSNARLTASLTIIDALRDDSSDFGCYRQRFIDELVGRHDPRHESGPLGFLSVHHPTGEAHLHGLGFADGTGEPLRSTHARE